MRISRQQAVSHSPDFWNRCGPFSAVSTPIFATKYSFFRHFSKSTGLSLHHSWFLLFFQNFCTVSENFVEILQDFTEEHRFCKILLEMHEILSEFRRNSRILIRVIVRLRYFREIWEICWIFGEIWSKISGHTGFKSQQNGTQSTVSSQRT